MRFTTYSKFVPGLAEAVNLQSLLDELGDFLLQSGFTGGGGEFWGDEGEDRSLESLRQAILQALIDSGQLTPEMLQYLRGEPSKNPASQRQIEQDLAQLLDEIVRRLMEEGYLNLEQAPQMPAGYSSLYGPGGQAASAARQIQFNLTEKGIDFLGYKTLKGLLGSIGKSSFGAHETPHLATGIEAESVSKQYEFGDTMNLDVPATLSRAIGREGLQVPIPLEYDDLMVHQAEYRSSAATVLMLDCSHSMILYGEDRFTPAKKVALALTHLIRTQYPGDSIRCLLFHDTAEEIPLAALAYDAGRALSHQHRGRAAPGSADSYRPEEGHEADHHDHRRQALGTHDAGRESLHEFDGARSDDPAGDLSRGGQLPAGGHHDQHLHAGPRPPPGGLREEDVPDLPRQGVLHDHHDAGSVHPDGFHEA
jgi:Uncharacterized protein with a von Willebrand factor type A (vWA) domain